jgi:hypothetical protein
LPVLPLRSGVFSSEVGFLPKEEQIESYRNGKYITSQELTWESKESTNASDEMGQASASWKVVEAVRDNITYFVSAEFGQALPPDKTIARVGTIPLTRDIYSLIDVIGVPSLSTGTRLKTFSCQWNIVEGTSPTRVFLIVGARVKDMLVRDMYVDIYYEEASAATRNREGSN